MANEDYNTDYAGDMGGDTLTDEQKAALLAQQSEMARAPQPQPGPAAPPPPPPPDLGQAYDQAALSGPGPAASAAWNQYAGTGQTSSPARVYPPVQPGMTGSRQIKGAPFQVTDPGDQAIRLAENMQVPLQQAQQAIDAQQRYQAQRGYQADLDRGVSAEDAAVKWFPLMMGSTTTRGGIGMPGMPGMTPQQKPMTAFQQSEADRWKAQQSQNALKWSVADIDENKALLAQDSKLQIELGKLSTMNFPKPEQRLEAQSALVGRREAVAKQRRALAAKYAGATAGTGTTPGPVAPPVALPRNRIYEGPNIQAPGQSDAQFMGDIPTGARAGAMNAQAARPVIRPPAPAPAPAAASNRKSVPAVGEVRSGWRFKGGDPSKQSSWERA